MSRSDRAICWNLDIQFGLHGAGSVALDGEDVSIVIRTDLGSDMASKIGAIPAARGAADRQLLSAKPGLVADGRDMGPWFSRRMCEVLSDC